MSRWLVFVWMCLVGSLSAAADRPAVGLGAEPVKAVSFNIRYGTARDGDNSWVHRREALIERLGSFEADVIGLQEALRFQLDEIAAGMTGYAEIGVGRDDGRTRGEYSPILVRADRFAIDASGTFWLSDSPEAIASRSWGNRIPRICTWARLVDKASGQGLYVYNVHMDHQSQPSRERAAELIAERMAARARSDEPVVLMGDFNAAEDNPAMLYVRGEADRASDADAWPDHEPAASPSMADSFRVVHPEATSVGTFCGYDPARMDGAKIDHVFVSEGVEVLEAAIDREAADGRYPSDHNAVWALISY